MLSFFLKVKKLDLVVVMLGLVKNLNSEYNMQVQYLHCDNTCKNVAFKKACK